MSLTSDVRAALVAGLVSSLGGLTPPAAATPVDPAEQAQVAGGGCAWIAKAVHGWEVTRLGGSPVSPNHTIAYTFDFQCYREAESSAAAALAAQTRIDEMLDAFTTWLLADVSLGGLVFHALPRSTSDEDAELQPRERGWTACALLRVDALMRPY